MTKATAIAGSIRVRHTYDIRVDPKTGQKSDVSPAICMCCGKKIFNIYELVNGDIVGSECEGIISFPAYRFGRNLTHKQEEYFISRGMLSSKEENPPKDRWLSARAVKITRDGRLLIKR